MSSPRRSSPAPRRRRADLTVRALASVLVVLVASACANSAPPPRRDVVVGLVGEPHGVFDDDPSARFLAAAVTETLVRRDDHDELVPRLAEAVPTMENGGLRLVTDDPTAPDGRLVATFRLRDAVWQDGAPITASDVRFAWEQDSVAAPGTIARWDAERIDRVDVVDARDLRVLYKNGERWDDYALAPRVLPSHRLAGASTAQLTAYAREPVHAGPFEIAAWLPGSLTLSAFKDYVMGPPGLGRIEVHFFGTRTEALDALLRGEIDMTPSPVLEADLAKTLDRFADGTRLQAYYKPAEALGVMRFGPDLKRFGDPLVRQAIELAIDRQSIVDDVFVGRARVPRTFLVPPLWAAAEEAVPLVGPDVTRARALLAQAGFVHGQFGIEQRAGERLVTTVFVASGSAARVEVARRVAGDLAALGIAADIRERPVADLAADVNAGHFDLAIVAMDASEPRLAAEAWAGLVDPWFDLLAAAAAEAPDRNEKRALYTEMQRFWATDLPALPLYQELHVDVAPQALGAVRPTAASEPLSWNAFEWSFAAR
jgi:peptide/nickel transport system substrate-binding protein